jgi:lipopolysaccharide transport system permease protein
VVDPASLGGVNLRELYSFRELFFILTWRDTSVKFKQTFFGLAWILLRPLFTIIVFTVVFGKLANLPSVGDTPYALVVCTGLLPWYLLSLALNDSASSLVANSGIISKVYFPRLILPISALLVNLIDFSISLLILLGLFAWYGVLPGWQIIFMPLFVALTLFVVLGPGLLFAALSVEYRDFRYIVPFIIQLGLYISPVAFSSAIVPEKWRILYSLNPAVGVIEGFRWCFIGSQAALYWPSVLFSLIFAAGFLWIGLIVFRRAEQTFVDVI